MDAGVREPRIDVAATVDVLVAGTAFLDLVLAGLPRLPAAGEEVWATRRMLSPGGIANQATAATRLGLGTAMVTAIGTDGPGDLLWRALTEEGLDLRWSRRIPGLVTPMTVALAHDGERSFVSHGRLGGVPIDRVAASLPLARAAFLSLDEVPDPRLPGWLREQRRLGCLVFTDVGWDPSSRWDAGRLDALADADVFLPNADEAMAYTRTDSPDRALTALTERVPLVVVTLGAAGAIALDAGTGERARCAPGPGVTDPAGTGITDPTGAGDVFTAAFMAATLEGLPLAERLAFATLCAGLSVRRLGGAISAPTRAQVVAAGWTPAEFSPDPREAPGRAHRP